MLFDVLEIAVVVLCAITYGLMLYFKVKGNLMGGVSELIALAESTGLAGKEKMSQVVDAMFDKVPAPLKKVLTKNCLEKIAQTIFDWMRRYSDEYRKNQDGEAPPKKTEEQIKIELTAAAGSLVADLLKLTSAELRELAEKRCIELNGATRKDDILKAVLVALLNQA